MTRRDWLRRLGRTTRKEVLFRARVAARTEAGRLASAWRPPRWRRDSLAEWMRGVSPEAREAIGRLREHDWAGAHSALRQHFVARPPSFPLHPPEFGRVRDEVLKRFPGAIAEASGRGARILEGQYDLLGYEGLRFPRHDARDADGGIDWHLDPVHGRRAPRAWWSRVPFLDPDCGDHKIIWELNRHQHWLALGRAAWLTGDVRYQAAFARELHDWLAENPPLLGINWASMLELSLRCIAWVWSLHAFAGFAGTALDAGTAPDSSGDESPWAVDLLMGIHEQMNHVERNLSHYFSPNTHLTGEALGLYVCGRALPELEAAPRWSAAGRQVLLEQIGRQILADGGHCERSAHYHRYTLDFYLLALATAQATGDEACEEPFSAAVERLAEAALLLADDGGRLPLLGDDDGGALFPICRRPTDDIRDSLALAAALLDRPGLSIGPPAEEPLWLIGRTAETNDEDADKALGAPRHVQRSGALPETGYFVSRQGGGHQAVIDCGPHGFLNGGHAHADALSLTMTVGGRPLFIDPGTGSYTVSPSLRDRLRCSIQHNTLSLDGRSQSIPAGPFRWATTAAAALQRWHTGQGLDYFEGIQDGYRPLLHRRRVVSLEDGFTLVVDSVMGTGDHRAEVHWHLDPSWTADQDEAGGLSLTHASGARHWLAAPGSEAAVFRGDEETGLGWCSPVYGRLTPCATVRLRKRGRPPIVVVSVVGWSGLPGNRPAVTILPGEVDRVLPEGEDDSLGIRLEYADATHVFLFPSRQPVMHGQADAPAPLPPPALAAFDTGEERIETDGRFVHLRRGPRGEMVRLLLLDGGHVRSSASAEPLAAERPVPALVVTAAGGR